MSVGTVDVDILDGRDRLGDILGNLRQNLNHHLCDGGVVVLLISLSLLVHGQCLGLTLLLNGISLGLTLGLDTHGLLLKAIAGGIALGILCQGALLSLILLSLSHALALLEVGGGINLHLIFISIGLLLDFGNQRVLLDFNLLFREDLLAACFLDLCLNGLDVDGLLLLLLLNGIGSVGISLCGVGLLLQGGALQGQVVVLDGDGSIGVHAGVVGLFVGMCHLNLHVALGIGTVDGGIFLDFGGIVGTQVVNESFLVGDVLNVTRDNLDAQLAHVG